MSETKTALITGAGRNIGRAVALALAGDGLNVVINGSADRAAADSVAAEARALGVRALVAMGDVGSRAGCLAVAEAALAEFGTVDVLVNNAALRPSKTFLETTEEDWRRVLGVDMEAAIWLSQACLPGMLARGWGRIVNFTGMNAIHGYSGRAPVSVAKHGLWGLTKSLGKEFGPKGITTNAISPGPIAADDEDENPTEYRQKMVARVPVGRMGQPREVAAVVRMLVSVDGAFVNGQMLQVNGGTET
ncbi:SDR family NAD(P)-dependent oxidoreductase [Falsiroseomonas selenitidurans]|uniref:SDR family oxidoreductase n=1 Tax=Falsiroseomonas selenitidurans TaxID=2716335 RepID=A0ABX1E9S7_9PROT|nr:SDR family oxidoreductase [Falsiroseomonas selenitidurans]NKC33947.1 SDR family oxidoreductase [Falsiroseomonas selenitidurans]